MRICKQCNQKFKPSSRHINCPGCRHKLEKTGCPRCYKLKRKESLLCVRCASVEQKLERNHNWKGGKTRHKSGYVYILTQEGYKFEHRVVMEQHLGRKLLTTEYVHHKNGLKHDNTQENLELWCKTHPTGTRIKDILCWARKILSQYGDEEKKL